MSSSSSSCIMRSNVFISTPTFPEEIITNEMIFFQYCAICYGVLCSSPARRSGIERHFLEQHKKRPCTQLRENRRNSQELIENPTNNNCRHRRFLEEVLRRWFFHECIQPIATHTHNFNVANE